MVWSKWLDWSHGFEETSDNVRENVNISVIYNRVCQHITGFDRQCDENSVCLDGSPSEFCQSTCEMRPSTRRITMREWNSRQTRCGDVCILYLSDRRLWQPFYWRTWFRIVTLHKKRSADTISRVRIDFGLPWIGRSLISKLRKHPPPVRLRPSTGCSTP
jgi:hypothetical protein